MDNKANVNTSKKREYTGEDGKFKEGNPGKPKGAISYAKKLEEALKEVEIKEGSIFKRFVERAFIRDKILIALMKKFIPDRIHSEIEGLEPIKLEIEHVGKKNKGNKNI